MSYLEGKLLFSSYQMRFLIHLKFLREMFREMFRRYWSLTYDFAHFLFFSRDIFLIGIPSRHGNTKRFKYRKSVYKKPTDERCLLILDLKPFRSYIKGNHSIAREFHSLALRGKTLLTWHPLTSRNGDRKIVQSIRITSRPSLRIRK